MHIKLINKKLLFGKYKVKCATGKRGISKKKKEGDNITPKGTFRFIGVFYRKDRVPLIKTKLKKSIIKRNMGWCDDYRSKFYNRMIKFPFKFRAEKFYRRKGLYDIILVLNYNYKPVIKNKGSAIFIHIASNKYSPTKGCIAISKKNMITLLSLISKKSKITIF